MYKDKFGHLRFTRRASVIKGFVTAAIRKSRIKRILKRRKLPFPK